MGKATKFDSSESIEDDKRAPRKFCDGGGM